MAGIPHATGDRGAVAVARKVLQVCSLGVAATVLLPTHGDDVDTELPRPRPKRWLDAPQAAFNPVELLGGNAALGRWVVATCLDLDSAVVAPAPRQDVDLAGRQREVAADNAIPGSAQPLACEFFSILTRVLGGIACWVTATQIAATQSTATWIGATSPLPQRVHHGRCARPRCDRTPCWHRRRGP